MPIKGAEHGVDKIVIKDPRRKFLKNSEFFLLKLITLFKNFLKKNGISIEKKSIKFNEKRINIKIIKDRKKVIETENPSQDCDQNFLKELLIKIK